MVTLIPTDSRRFMDNLNLTFALAVVFFSEFHTSEIKASLSLGTFPKPTIN